LSSGGVEGETELEEQVGMAAAPSSVAGDSGTQVEGEVVAVVVPPFGHTRMFGSSGMLEACEGLAEFGMQRSGSRSRACISLRRQNRQILTY
jgi:hypothetical protein